MYIHKPNRDDVDDDDVTTGKQWDSGQAPHAVHTRYDDGTHNSGARRL